MDDDAPEARLMADLLACAGALMEDESVTLLLVSRDRGQLRARIERLRQVAADLTSLASADSALIRIGENQADLTI